MPLSQRGKAVYIQILMNYGQRGGKLDLKSEVTLFHTLENTQ